jgi:HAD superfamily hydrolase (TIGR01490 family)
MPGKGSDRRIAALFDFDGTILEGNSFHVFITHMARRFPLSAPQLATALVRRKARRISAEQLKNVVLAPLTGWREEEIAEFGRAFYANRLQRRVRATAAARLRWHLDAGHEVHVLSGAFDFILEPFCREHSLPSFRGSALEHCSGRFTGRLSREFLGEEKAEHVRILADQGQIDLSASYAYSDEFTDLPMLSMVGKPVLVESRRIRDRRQHTHIEREKWV